MMKTLTGKTRQCNQFTRRAARNNCPQNSGGHDKMQGQLAGIGGKNEQIFLCLGKNTDTIKRTSQGW